MEFSKGFSVLLAPFGVEYLLEEQREKELFSLAFTSILLSY